MDFWRRRRFFLAHPQNGGESRGDFLSGKFWCSPPEWGGAKFSDFEWLTPIMGGSPRGIFLGLRGSPGGVFEVAHPHLKEADRNPYLNRTVNSEY